jgi:hypothetical protein
VKILSQSSGPVGADATFQARVPAVGATGTAVANEGNCISPSDVASIACSIFDLSGTTPGTAVASPAITSAAFTVLTLDNYWSEGDLPLDAIGRNFWYTVAGSVFSIGQHMYRVVLTVTLNGGGKVEWGHEHYAVALTPGT